jgi:alpha-tubulin suppressor-like RCC1 family protein
MFRSNHSLNMPLRDFAPFSRLGMLLLGATAVAGIISCGSDSPTDVDPPVDVATISIDTPSVQLERGAHQVFTATAKDSKGKVVGVPFVWRSSDESVASVDLSGRVTAHIEGTVTLTASSLGATSPAVGVRVVWLGAAKLATSGWTPPNAATPSTPVSDSIRVVATTKTGTPARGTSIVFNVTGGGGKLATTKATTDANGIAAAQWTLGPSNGVNTVTATVVDDDGNAIPWVNPNVVTFAVKTYKALDVVAGAQQSGTILSALPIAPSVRLVDSTGKPRQGIPVTFAATAGGQLTFPIVSTGADGVASPGIWTLGDLPGDQGVIATVESATITVHATGTGTPIRFIASQVSAGGSSSCALLTDSHVDCWGEVALVGDGDTLSRSVPTPTQGNISFKSVMTGLSHACGIAADDSLYCWGFNTFVDTTGKTTGSLSPVQLPGDLRWAQITTGLAHTCGIATSQAAYCWGQNVQGQLGIAVADSIHLAPTAVYGGFKFTTLAAGVAHSCGLATGGVAFCWGLNTNGQLGDGTTVSRVAPTLVSNNLTFQSIGTGELWSCALDTAGRAYCWGVIPGVTQAQATPLAVGTAPVFTSLTVGGAHACGLTSDGTAYCWGANNAGQLGDSTTTGRILPTKVAGGLKFLSISAGDAHTCGRGAPDGAVLCWGLNRFGDLGTAKAPFFATPRYIILGVNP